MSTYFLITLVREFQVYYSVKIYFKKRGCSVQWNTKHVTYMYNAVKSDILTSYRLFAHFVKESDINYFTSVRQRKKV